MFVGGVDWLKHAKEWFKGEVSPDLMYQTPVDRLYCLLFDEPGVVAIKDPRDWGKVRKLIEERKRQRAAGGTGS